MAKGGGTLSPEDHARRRHAAKARQKKGNGKGKQPVIRETILELCQKDQKRREARRRWQEKRQQELDVLRSQADDIVAKTAIVTVVRVEQPTYDFVRQIKESARAVANTSDAWFNWNTLDNGDFVITRTKKKK